MCSLDIVSGNTFIELGIVGFEMRGSCREACPTAKFSTSVVVGGVVASTLLSIALAERLINNFRTVILLLNVLLSRRWFVSGYLCNFNNHFVMNDYLQVLLSLAIKGSVNTPFVMGNIKSSLKSFGICLVSDSSYKGQVVYKHYPHLK